MEKSTNQILSKKEKIVISEEDLFKSNPELFQKIGKPVIIDENNMTYENENLSVSLSYESSEKYFNEFGNSSQASLFTGENPQINLEDFWRLTKFTLSSGGVIYDINEEEKSPIVLFRKSSKINDISGGAYIYANIVEIGSEPSSPQAILTLMHELGHINDEEQIQEDDTEISDIELRAIFAGAPTLEMDRDKSAIILRQERHAWAYALKKIKPFLGSMNIKEDGVKKLVHDFALGLHCRALPNTDS
jgi:hypothetical protein